MSAAAPGAAAAQDDIGQVSVGELITDLTRDLSTLMRQELELAKAELKTEAAKSGKAVGMLGGAGFAAYMVVLFLSVALWAGLSNVMDPGWAGLLVALVWAIVAGALYSSGRSRIRTVSLKPERTVETVREAPGALKGHRGEME